MNDQGNQRGSGNGVPLSSPPGEGGYQPSPSGAAPATAPPSAKTVIAPGGLPGVGPAGNPAGSGPNRASMVPSAATVLARPAGASPAGTPAPISGYMPLSAPAEPARHRVEIDTGERPGSN